MSATPSFQVFVFARTDSSITDFLANPTVIVESK